MEGTSLKSLYVKRVYLQRDYSKGIKIKFENSFPQVLQDILPESEFTQFINSLNDIYAEAEQLKLCEGCFACLTAYLLYCCIDTHKQKTMRRASEFIQAQNLDWKNYGVTVKDPLKTGFRVIEIEYLQRS